MRTRTSLSLGTGLSTSLIWIPPRLRTAAFIRNLVFPIDPKISFGHFDGQVRNRALVVLAELNTAAETGEGCLRDGRHWLPCGVAHAQLQDSVFQRDFQQQFLRTWYAEVFGIDFVIPGIFAQDFGIE